MDKYMLVCMYMICLMLVWGATLAYIKADIKASEARVNSTIAYRHIDSYDIISFL